MTHATIGPCESVHILAVCLLVAFLDRHSVVCNSITLRESCFAWLPMFNLFQIVEFSASGGALPMEPLTNELTPSFDMPIPIFCRDIGYNSTPIHNPNIYTSQQKSSKIENLHCTPENAISRELTVSPRCTEPTRFRRQLNVADVDVCLLSPVPA